LLVDDHAMVRQGLRSVLDGYADIEVIGEASDGEEAVAMTERLRPSLVLMDVNMPRMSGIEATVRIKARQPDIVIIGLSVQAGHESHLAMLKAGATRLLTKEAAVDELHHVILHALNRSTAVMRQ
jgi:DNA-binding NarL/FixJ family response regulator